MSAEGGGRFTVLVRAWLERFRSSLFGLPALWVLGGVAASFATVELDRLMEDGDLPDRFIITVDSARALLGAIATGTITSASVVFSLTLVTVQLSSSAYSSRVLRTFLRDRLQRNVMGFVTASFAYSMLVLREVRGPLEEVGGDPFVPRVSTLVATVLAVLTLLALIASINNTAQSLRVSNVALRIVADVRSAVDARFPVARPRLAVDDPGVAPQQPVGRRSAPEATSGVGAVLTASSSGWLQQISPGVIVEQVPEGSTVRLEVSAGSYVGEGDPLMTVWPPPADAELDEMKSRLAGAFSIGAERTLLQDVGFGIVMLEDIALRALSSGINDPNTARAVLEPLAQVVEEILARPFPPSVVEEEGRRVLRPFEVSQDGYVRMAFDQLRQEAAGQPVVLVAVVRSLDRIGRGLQRRGAAAPVCVEALAAQIDAIAELADDATFAAMDRRDLDEAIAAVAWR